MLSFLENVFFVLIGIFAVFIFIKLPEMEKRSMEKYLHIVEIEAVVKNSETKKNELKSFSLLINLPYKCSLDKLVDGGHVLTTINGTRYIKVTKNDYVSVEKFKDISLVVEGS